MRKQFQHIQKHDLDDLKKIVVFGICVFSLISCKGKINTDVNDNLNGEYYYSEDKNISYFFPEGFLAFISEDEADYNEIVSSISNLQLKNILSGNYIEAHVLPVAEGFEFLYNEDANTFQSIFLNEVKYFRLNDTAAEILASSNRMAMNSINKDTTTQLNVNRDYFINKRDYQMVVNKGNFIRNNDTIFWENYIVSKFYRTFSIQIESNTKFDFLPYIKKIEFGDKRQNL